jgi:hypothetical protein
MEPEKRLLAAKWNQGHQLPYLDLVPVLAREGVHSLLLKALLAL